MPFHDGLTSGSAIVSGCLCWIRCYIKTLVKMLLRRCHAHTALSSYCLCVCLTSCAAVRYFSCPCASVSRMCVCQRVLFSCSHGSVCIRVSSLSCVIVCV